MGSSLSFRFSRQEPPNEVRGGTGAALGWGLGVGPGAAAGADEAGGGAIGPTPICAKALPQTVSARVTMSPAGSENENREEVLSVSI